MRVLWQKFINSVYVKEYPYRAFGIFALISYPAYYAMWFFSDKSRYENVWLRIIVCLLAIPLIFEKKWPLKLRRYINFYWYAVIMFSLPLMFTFILFKNQFSSGVVLDVSTIVLLTVLLLDFIPMVILTALGIFLGWLLFLATGDSLLPAINYLPMIRTYSFTILFGAIFAHRIDKEKLQSMKALVATLSHELRTPIGSIKSGIAGIKNYLPEVIKGYILARENKLITPKMRKDHLKTLSFILDSIGEEANHASNIMEMLFTNIKHREIKADIFEIYSISECIEYALTHYSFYEKQQEKIIWNPQDNVNFEFYGDKLLIIHVLYNLLKNALYFIEKAKKGQIKIWLGQTLKYNALHFKDTAIGIAKKYQPLIFDQFFTRNTHRGSGIGLSFCKMVMESVGGQIFCKSIEGEFAEFVLLFPKLKN